MIFSRVQLLDLLERQDQVFYIDETSFYTRVEVYNGIFLNTQPSAYRGDKLGRLFSIHNRLGTISPIEHKVHLKRAQDFIDSDILPG